MSRNFYMYMPKNFIEMYLFKLYIISIGRIFYKKDVDVYILVKLVDSSYTDKNELTELFDDLIATLNITLTLIVVEKFNETVENKQIDSFKKFNQIETIKDTILSYKYQIFTSFFLEISKVHNDLKKVMDRYDLFNKKFYSIFNILKTMQLKTNNLIILNISNNSIVKLPINYYINSIAYIFKFNKISKNNIHLFKIIICQDEIKEEIYNYYVDEICKSIINLSPYNFVSVSKLITFFPNLSNEEITFYLNKLSIASICSSQIYDLFPCFLKQHKTLDSELIPLTLYSKYLFLNTLIARSVGI